MAEHIRPIGDKAPIPVQIPAAQDLYDETRITLLGTPITEIRRELTGMPQGHERQEALQTLEVGLATARLEIIKADTRYASLSDRNRAIAELGKYTYEVALDLEYPELQEVATQLLSDGLGSWDRAARAIEGIKTARRLREK